MPPHDSALRDAPASAAPPSAHDEPGSAKPHWAARIEDRWRAVVSRVQRARGWTPRVEPFAGLGSTRQVRVLARVLLTSPDYRRKNPERTADRRGWRYFLTAPAPDETVQVHVGGTTVDLRSDRSGYLDALVDVELSPGWHDVTLRTSTGATASAPVLVVEDGRRLGVVSDIDDTIMVTAVPRPLLAAWNTFVRHTSTRVPVAGMAALYRGIAAAHPGTPFVYVSTGAWNTAANLNRFLERHGFPPGPLLLTDWGPTNTGWFRSGRQHKESSLDRLLTRLPDVHWLLVGDDGQHDPEIYARVARLHPDQVVAVAIRELTPAQQVLSHGTPLPTPPGEEAALHAGRHATSFSDAHAPVDVPSASGPDGRALAHALRRVLRSS